MSDTDAPNGTISWGLPMGDRNEPHSTRTMLEMVAYDAYHGGRHMNKKRPFLTVAGATVTNARNEIVRQFLAQPEGEQSDWLLFLDDDQVYPEYLLDLLMVSADAVERPVIGLAVWRFITNDRGPIRVTHNVFDMDEQGRFVEWTDPFPENALVQVAGVGTGCMLIHRTVLEAVRAKSVERGLTSNWCWFLEQVFMPADTKEGEDIFFCRRIGELGIPLFVNTSVTLQHAKTIMLQGPAPAGSLSIGGEPGWFYPPKDEVPEPKPEPFTDRVAVIVPVLRRPQNAAPFMMSVALTTEQATVYAIADDDDVETAEAWRKAGATVIPSTGSTFAIKVNDGYRATSEPWLFVVGDDVRFHPGWVTNALASAGPFDVIGTNDLLNPRVTSGQHATHMFIRRSYVFAVGASWDGPGVVCHEGYKHWFVDDEIVTAAKQRGAFRSAQNSIVEHLHPLGQKVKDDEVYKLGRSFAKQDQALFHERVAKYVAA